MAQRAHRVLVVDDEAEVREIIRRVLGERGYIVAEAANGRLALQRLQEEPFELLITDLRMPEMDGEALLQACAALYPQMDIIVLTAYGTIQSAVEAMKRGAADFITKPFRVAELEQKVAECLRRREARLEAQRNSPIAPLVELGRILSGEMGLGEMLRGIIELLQRTFRPAGAEVILYGEEAADQDTAIIAHVGKPPHELGYPRLSRAQARRLAQSSKPWLLRDPGQAEPLASPAQSGLGLTVPLLHGDEVTGMITLAREAPGERYGEADAQLLQLMGFQMSLSALQARMRQRLLDAFQDLKRTNLSAVQALFAALETRDRYTHDHSERVSRFAHWLGERLGLPDGQLEALRIAGLLHDIGKLGVSDGTLYKNSQLNDEEREHIKRHPTMGARILAGMEAFAEALPIVRHHHERYDGKGYPDGLAGEAIPFGARLLAVVDAFDSLISDRPYRPAMPLREALRRLREGAGTQWDRALVEAWCALVAEREDEILGMLGVQP